MKSSKYRDMRILLFFDLPVKTKQERKNYQKFRDFLLDDGYLMVQYSVYSRFCRNHAAVRKHQARILKNKPRNGEVRFMIITEQQYLAMQILNGDFNYHEKTINANPIIEV